MDTDKLIQRLAESAEPVRPLRRPSIRTAAWLSLSIPYVALVVFMMSPRADLVEKMSDLRFVLEQVAALATGIGAATLAFATTSPGYNRKFFIFLVLPLAVWLGSLVQRCVGDWMQFGFNGLWLQPDWVCFPAILLVGAIPAIAMAIMLRRGAPLTPYATAAMGGLAAAGLGNFGLRLFHPQDASLMVLVWQVGTVIVLSALAGWAGPYLLNWHSIIDAARRKAAIG